MTFQHLENLNTHMWFFFYYYYFFWGAKFEFTKHMYSNGLQRTLKVESGHDFITFFLFTTQLLMLRIMACRSSTNISIIIALVFDLIIISFGAFAQFE